MTPAVFILTLIGVSYVSMLLTRFFIWIDGAEEEEASLQIEAGCDRLSEQKGGQAYACIGQSRTESGILVF